MQPIREGLLEPCDDVVSQQCALEKLPVAHATYYGLEVFVHGLSS